VETTLDEITCDDLWEKIQRGDEFVLVDALSPISYAGAHLPGAINMPLPSSADVAARKIPSYDTEVVVYCSGPDCDSSVEVAQQLVALGYWDVRHFAGGKLEWRAAGLPLEGGRV
jgi:rhodanese-related sulfurtransferase